MLKSSPVDLLANLMGQKPINCTQVASLGYSMVDHQERIININDYRKALEYCNAFQIELEYEIYFNSIGQQKMFIKIDKQLLLV